MSVGTPCVSCGRCPCCGQYIPQPQQPWYGWPYAVQPNTAIGSGVPVVTSVWQNSGLDCNVPVTSGYAQTVATGYAQCGGSASGQKADGEHSW